MLRGPHWYATPQELDRFRDDAGELVAMIPTKQVEKALDAVAGVNTLLGVGGMTQRRLAVDAQLAAQRRPQAPQKPPQPPQPQSGPNTKTPESSHGGPPGDAQSASNEMARKETVPATRLNGILAGT